MVQVRRSSLGCQLLHNNGRVTLSAPVRVSVWFCAWTALPAVKIAMLWGSRNGARTTWPMRIVPPLGMLAAWAAGDRPAKE